MLMDTEYAVEMHYKDKLTLARSQGRVTALTFASDESPPKFLRYVGLRFQVTYVYTVHYEEPSTWDSDTFRRKMPCRREKYLTDVCNCPNKYGSTVKDVKSKQIQRIGFSFEDCVGGVGDGGGENEGAAGVHSLVEEQVPSYVRRRCLHHIPWRVADKALEVADEHFDSLHYKTKQLSNYLHDGVTYSRLKAISVTPIGQGG